MGMVRDASDGVIVRSTIELAHNMGLSVVAEWRTRMERLRTFGCDIAQGFYRAARAADRWPPDGEIPSRSESTRLPDCDAWCERKWSAPGALHAVATTP
jgi:EAL domain-containing protein (putative c-di-GMP-specific phosphodiesterase class I)